MSEQNNLGVYRAITKVTAALAKEGIGKDRKNLQQGYSFRGIDDIYNALSRMLSDAGLCIIPRIMSREMQERTTKSGSPLFYVIVEAEYDLVAAEDGSKHTARVFGEAMDSADKATNKAMSAAYKYMAFQTFAIPTEGDNDADAHTPEIKQKERLPTLTDDEAEKAYNEWIEEKFNYVHADGSEDKEAIVAAWGKKPPNVRTAIKKFGEGLIQPDLDKQAWQHLNNINTGD